MADLVERLRKTRLLSQRNQLALQREAADEIERLRATTNDAPAGEDADTRRVAELRSALESNYRPKIGEGDYAYAKLERLPFMLREQAKDALFFACEPHVTIDAWNIVQMAADELGALLKPTPTVGEGAEAWPGRNADLQRRRVVTLATLGLMLSKMAGGEAAEVDGFDAAALYADVLMALAIEDADNTDIALEIARDHPEGDALIAASPSPAIPEEICACYPLDMPEDQYSLTIKVQEDGSGRVHCDECGKPMSPVNMSRAEYLAPTPASHTADIGEANHDCLAKRRLGEPMFILLGRDPDAHNIVRSWAERRLAAGGDPDHCNPVLALADQMQAYAADPDNAPASAPPASAYPVSHTAPDAGAGNTRRLAMEDAEQLERIAEEADNSNWQDWAALMRQSAMRIRALATPAPSDRGAALREAAIEQNDAMRQELANVGNLVSDLARAMRVDQANVDGSWPDLAGRIRKLIEAVLTTPAPSDRGEVERLREALRELEDAATAIENISVGRGGSLWFGLSWAIRKARTALNKDTTNG